MNGLLIGYGSIGRRHLANFHELGVRDWAVVHTGKGTLPFEPPCPVRRYSNLDEALEREHPGFAVIANPTSLHVSTAIACLNAGYHTLVEKPLSHSLDGLKELAEAATGEQRSLVGFQFRFHPALRRIQQLVTGGKLGAPLHARVVWGEYLPSWHPWEDWRSGYAARAELGGGAHHTLSHPLDYLQMLFGPPAQVSASLTTNGPLGMQVAEGADVLLRFPSDVTAEVHLDYWSRPTRHRLELVFTEGSVEWDYLTGAFRTWSAADETWLEESLPGVADRNELFRTEAGHFLDVIRGDAQPVCPLEDGIALVRLCSAIERSASAGAAVTVQPLTDRPLQ